MDNKLLTFAVTVALCMLGWVIANGMRGVPLADRWQGGLLVGLVWATLMTLMTLWRH